MKIKGLLVALGLMICSGTSILGGMALAQSAADIELAKQLAKQQG